MPSKGFTVDTTDRNDVVSFYQAIFKASEGFESRPMWDYEPDFGTAYSYTYNANIEPPILKNRTDSSKLASGRTSLSFVKDVERRVNFYRALAGVPASASLMDSDTTRNSSTIQPALSPNPPYPVQFPAYEPPITTTKAEAVQHSAYLISRSYLDKNTYAAYAVSHKQEATFNSGKDRIIDYMMAWNKMTWNAHRHSNISRGYYGPRAIDKYVSEDISGTSSTGDITENTSVGHRRKVLLSTATNFATGDIPPEYDESRTSSKPKLREASNALYHLHRPEELATVPARFVAYPNAGFFPAPLNSPYWSLTRPGASFTGATVTMTDSVGGTVAVTDLTISSTPEPSISWRVNNANATATNITTDRTFNVTVSNFTISGAPASPYSYSVTLINPDLITSPQTITGAAQPPANGSAAYLLTPPPGAEAIQVNAFVTSTTPWEENGAAPLKIKDLTHSNYALIAKPNQFVAPSVEIIATPNTPVFRLSHAVRYDAAAEGIPDEIFELDREILPKSGTTATLNFNYQRGYMTDASTLVVETSDNDGANWNALGTAISGHISSSGTGLPQTIKLPLWTANIPASTVPLRIRFRFYKSKVGTSFSTYNHSDSGWNNRATGIFINKISTTNTTWMDIKKTNEVAANTTKFTLNNTSAGVTLTNGSALLLRTRAKLGDHWFQYGPSKVVTPTSAPTLGFAGFVAYDYPELTGGFAGDHDGDGVPNAVEFAFYENPVQPGTSSDTIVLNVSSGLGKAVDTIAIQRSIPSPRTGFDYGAEWSDTLAPGSWQSTGVSVTFPAGKVMATAPAGTGKRFLRWKFVE